MKKMLALGATSALAVVALATSAAAAPVTIDFSNAASGSIGGAAGQQTFNGTGPLPVTVTGYENLPGGIDPPVTLGDRANVTRTTGANGGLGVNSTNECLIPTPFGCLSSSGDDPNQIDIETAFSLPRANGGEGVQILFGEGVRLVNIVFTLFANGDDVDFEFGFGNIAGEALDDITVTGSGSTRTFTASGAYTSLSDRFFVAAVFDELSGVDAFRVKSITVDLPVPEPAALGLLGMGILGIAATRRRRAA